MNEEYSGREWEDEERAERRHAELENSGEFVALSDEEIEERDRAWEKQRSIWDRYQERFEAENSVEIRDLRRLRK